MSNQHLQLVKNMKLSTAIENLESLVECLKQKTIYVNHRGRTVLLHPGGPVDIEVKARIKADRSGAEEGIVLTLEW